MEEVPEKDKKLDQEEVQDLSLQNTITTIVDDSEVEKVSSAIASAAFTGKGGDGIIIVTNVESALNIASKKTGSEAL